MLEDYYNYKATPRILLPLSPPEELGTPTVPLGCLLGPGITSWNSRGGSILGWQPLSLQTLKSRKEDTEQDP